MFIVFGGTGFFGQHTVKALVAAGEGVVVNVHKRRGMPVLLRDDVERGAVILEPVDVTDPDAVMGVVSRHKPEKIIDMSGYKPKSLPPGREVMARVGGQVNVLEAAKAHDVKRVVFTSSFDAYWGLGPESVPYKEDMFVPLLEDTDNFFVQSWAKKALEVIGNLYRRQESMDIVFVRAGGAYGPLYRTFLSLPSRLVKAAIAQQEPDFGADKGGVPFAEDGYDLTYIKDIGIGMSLVAMAKQLKHPVYNLGGGRATTYGEMANAVMKAGPGFKVQLRPGRPERKQGTSNAAMGNFYMDISRIQDELGYRPAYSLESGIAEYAEWLRTHAE